MTTITTQDIEAMARAAADEAIAQGATAPWGDGETLAGADAEALRGAPQDVLRAYDRAFRARIDSASQWAVGIEGEGENMTVAATDMDEALAAALAMVRRCYPDSRGRHLWVRSDTTGEDSRDAGEWPTV